MRHIRRGNTKHKEEKLKETMAHYFYSLRILGNAASDQKKGGHRSLILVRVLILYINKIDSQFFLRFVL